MFARKEYDELSVFEPEALVREARRQKDLAEKSAPDICVLDPDGDIADHLVSEGVAEEDPTWPGYHTSMYRFPLGGEEVGLIPHAVGASFAVLVVEQLAAVGCEYVVSVTSAGQVTDAGETPYFVLIDRALRDEGTSHHYAPPERYAEPSEELIDVVEEECGDVEPTVHRGGSWTTDAPFRETDSAIEHARSEGVLAVEMEASALYALAEVRDIDVVCFAHVTNEMGRAEEDFEKGQDWGSKDALKMVDAARRAFRRGPTIRIAR